MEPINLELGVNVLRRQIRLHQSQGPLIRHHLITNNTIIQSIILLII